MKQHDLLKYDNAGYKHSSQLVADAVNDVRRGIPIITVAESYGLALPTLRGVCRRVGASVRQGRAYALREGAGARNAALAEAARDIAAGGSLTAVADQHRLARSTLGKFCKDNGIKSGRRGRPRMEFAEPVETPEPANPTGDPELSPMDEAMGYVQSGYSLTVASKRYEVSRSGLAKRCRHAGISSGMAFGNDSAGNGVYKPPAVAFADRPALGAAVAEVVQDGASLRVAAAKYRVPISTLARYATRVRESETQSAERSDHLYTIYTMIYS